MDQLLGELVKKGVDCYRKVSSFPGGASLEGGAAGGASCAGEPAGGASWAGEAAGKKGVDCYRKVTDGSVPMASLPWDCPNKGLASTVQSRHGAREEKTKFYFYRRRE